MHTFLNEFHKIGKYSAQISRHETELRKWEMFTDQKYSSFSFLQTDYLNIDSNSCCGRYNEIANTFQTKFKFCGYVNHSIEKYFRRIRQKKSKVSVTGDSNNRQTEHTPCKFFRCGSKDHLISKFPRP